MSAKENHEEIFNQQERQYEYPYHHIPSFLPDGTGTRTRNLHWGFDYLTCVFQAKRKVEAWKPNSVLEVGCGDGAVIGNLDQNIERLVGMDLSEKAISFAKAFIPHVEFHAKDAADINEQFDVVMAVETLEHIPDEHVSSFLNTLYKRTKPTGKIYISVPSINLPLYDKHYRHYSPDSLVRQVEEAGLDVKVLEADFYRVPVPMEEFYKKLTNNRLFLGEFHPLRRRIWKKIMETADNADPQKAQHVYACLQKG